MDNDSHHFCLPALLLPTKRLYRCPLPIVAITGGIASGKSSVASILLAQGFAVISADHLIREIYKKTEILDFLQKACPEVLEEGPKINFALLRKIFFSPNNFKDMLLQKLYSHLPEVFQHHLEKITHQVIFYDVPLLFETNIQSQVDYIICVYVPPQLQLQRLMARDHLSPELAQQIIDHQLSIEVKRKLTPYVINNTGDESTLAAETWMIMDRLLNSQITN